MILVCGDAMIDRYWFGEVERISPEAPVPVCKIVRTEERQGGAANVANNVESLGSPVIRVFSPSVEKVVKIRVIGRSQQVVRVDFDLPQDPVDIDEFSEALTHCEMVVFSDYGKGSLRDIRGLIHLAKDSGKKVLVDPKGHDYRRYRGADLVKPNLHEMKELVGGWSTEDELMDKAQVLLKEAGIGAILLTRQDKGMTLYEKDSAISIPAKPVEVYDVSGAGDTAIAAFSVALSRGMGFSESAEYSTKAAGIAVSHFGTYVVKEEEVFGL